jgi:hypothetical protein
LTGRAVPGGELKVVAGSDIQEGEQINICYGGGVAGNERFLQDYGFLDGDEVAFDLTSQHLLGKKRILEGPGSKITTTDSEAALEALRTTSMSEDEALLASETDRAVRSAIQFRLGLKRALSKYIIVS